MSCKPAIQIKNLSKYYQLYASPQDRLKQFLWRGKRQFYKEFIALKDINFKIMPGEVVGIVGRNGAGKSTLLQLICGTLTATHGDTIVNGRIAALLELGAGFNPEFTGRENVFMSATIMGMSHEDITSRFDEIVEFSGISDFIDQPVKTYSSGMYVRLAFSVAINVDPDILVIDEALSVGDGAFSRKSFDRIMKLKNAGKTILFCSHSLYQIEVLCDRAIWLNKGKMEMIDVANIVTNKYAQSLIEPTEKKPLSNIQQFSQKNHNSTGSGRFTNIRVSVDGLYENPAIIKSEKSLLKVDFKFDIDASLPPPSIGLMISTLEGVCISSASTYHDDIDVTPYFKNNSISLSFPSLHLLRGDYLLTAFLGCENALHIYDTATDFIQLKVENNNTLLGLLVLPHHWDQ